MRAHTPQDGEGPSSRRSSTNSRFRPGASTLPRPGSSLRESRIASIRANQPSYNLATGTEYVQRPSSRQQGRPESTRPSSRESSKENLAPPDADEYEKYRKEIEALKAEIGTLQYRMQTAEQEKEIALSQQNNKLEQARRREQEEAQQRQAAEAAQTKAVSLVEHAKREAEELKLSMEQEKGTVERQAWQAQQEASILQEQLKELASGKDEAARIADKKINDLQMQVAAAQQSLNDHEQESQARESTVQHVHNQLVEKDEQIARLEAEVLRLKAQSGDADTMEIIKGELSEQVQHIRALEAANRDQLSELKHLRSIHKAIEVVEEEKRTLQRRLEAAEQLENELTEARIQRQRLEDERLAWTAYLKNASETGEDEFTSPESMARALVQERLTIASYVEKLGAAQAEATAQQSMIDALDEEKRQLKAQVEEARNTASASSTDKVRLRVERQRAMAIKEVEYLRAQLKTFDIEDETLQPEQFDQARAKRVSELEGLIDEYKSEVQDLHIQLSSSEGASTPMPPPVAGHKRSRADDEATDEQIGQLNRKNRKLQDEMSALQTQVSLLENDLSASQKQLAAAKTQNKTRVLSLRSNPTSDYEAIKRSTLDALQKENKHLLATLRSKAPQDQTVPCIPTSVLKSMEREIAAAKAETASAQKSARRLKEVWASKSQEFKEAIFSTLGWTVTFIPNGKMRVESTFFPSQTDEHENSIVFDGERGTMKVGGGPKSAFARRIGDQIGFWVREKGCIPGFLAALTLEFYEEHAKSKSDN